MIVVFVVLILNIKLQMSKFYDVEYEFYGLICHTTLLADGKEQIQKILGAVKIISYKESSR